MRFAFGEFMRARPENSLSSKSGTVEEMPKQPHQSLRPNDTSQQHERKVSSRDSVLVERRRARLHLYRLPFADCFHRYATTADSSSSRIRTLSNNHHHGLQRRAISYSKVAKYSRIGLSTRIDRDHCCLRLLN